MKIIEAKMPEDKQVRRIAPHTEKWLQLKANECLYYTDYEEMRSHYGTILRYAKKNTTAMPKTGSIEKGWGIWKNRG